MNWTNADVTSLASGGEQDITISSVPTGRWPIVKVFRPAPTVALLCHFNGSNGGTTFTDSSTNAFTATTSGSPTLSTTQQKFGATSLRLNGSSYVQYANSVFDPGTNDFTVECWFRPDNGGAQQAIFGSMYGVDDQNGILIGTFSSNLYWAIRNSGSWLVGPGSASGAGGLSSNTWYHLALTRSGTTFRLWLNGSLAASSTSSSAVGTSGKIAVGHAKYDWTPFTGYVDEFMFVTGYAKYTSAFSPPAYETALAANSFDEVPNVSYDVAGGLGVKLVDSTTLRIKNNFGYAFTGKVSIGV